jgi:hypothetical protein
MIARDAAGKEGPMQAYVYGKKRVLSAGFEEFAAQKKAAIVSIDMHQGHLANTPDCKCEEEYQSQTRSN